MEQKVDAGSGVWRYAGYKADASDAETSSVISSKPITRDDGHSYWLSRGYYVPCYDAQHGRNIRRFSVLEQKTRFFNFAEFSINSFTTAEDINNDYESYRAESNPEAKRVRGAMVVGAMISRTARIEQALLINHAGGLALEDVVDQSTSLDTHGLERLKAELKAYTKILFTDKDLVGCVRRSNGEKDREGVLADIIRETLKAYGQDGEMPVRNAVEKIGAAMVAIDETKGIISQSIGIIEQHHKSLVKDKLGDFRDKLDRFVEASRMRVGIKSSDHFYSEVHLGYAVAKGEVFKMVGHAIEAARESKIYNKERALMTLTIIKDGLNLIDDMTQIRYPRNQLAFIGMAPEECKKSSVEELAERVERIVSRSAVRSI